MLKKLDPRLRFLLRALPAPAVTAETGAQIAEVEATPTPAIDVLVRCRKELSLADLQNVGMQVHAETRGAYLVVAGEISLEALPALSDLSAVLDVEYPRLMQADLDLSRVETKIAGLQKEPTGPRGAGVVVGVVDGGIDYSHPCFRHSDGSSRILFLWDQAAPSIAGEQVPYGREYTKLKLDRALAGPESSIAHQDLGDKLLRHEQPGDSCLRLLEAALD
jgi:hypothetical protein